MGRLVQGRPEDARGGLVKCRCRYRKWPGVAWRREPRPGAEGTPMTPISADRCYAEIEASTETLAGLVDGADLTIPIPTCPDWTLRQLATHVGRAHRWAAEIAATR